MPDGFGKDGRVINLMINKPCRVDNYKPNVQTLRKYFEDTLLELLQFMKFHFGMEAKSWEDLRVDLGGYANKHVDKYDDQVLSLATLFADMRAYYSTKPDKTEKKQSERNQRLVAPGDKKATR